MALAVDARVVIPHARNPFTLDTVPLGPAYLLHRVTCQDIEDDRDAGVHSRVHGAAGGRADHGFVVASRAAHLGGGGREQQGGLNLGERRYISCGLAFFLARVCLHCRSTRQTDAAIGPSTTSLQKSTALQQPTDYTHFTPLHAPRHRWQ